MSAQKSQEESGRAACVKSDIILHIKAKRLEEVSFPQCEIVHLIPLTGLKISLWCLFLSASKEKENNLCGKE